MKNKMFRIAVSTALVASIAMPFVASAEIKEQPGIRADYELQGDRKAARDAAKEERDTKRLDAVCEALSVAADRAVAKFGERRTSIDGARDDRDGARDQARTEHSDAFATRRAEHDAKVDERFDALLDRADTDAARAAILAFQQAVQNAVSDRRAAYLAAHGAYLEGIDEAREEQREAVDEAGETLRRAVEAAATKVEADCAAGEDAEGIRTTFRTALKEAQTAFRTAVVDARSLSAEVASLKEVRDAAYAAARADFQEALTSAKDDLRTALAALRPVADSDDEAGDNGDEEENE
jgi:hypothetical protein